MMKNENEGVFVKVGTILQDPKYPNNPKLSVIKEDDEYYYHSDFMYPGYYQRVKKSDVEVIDAWIPLSVFMWYERTRYKGEWKKSSLIFNCL